MTAEQIAALNLNKIERAALARYLDGREITPEIIAQVKEDARLIWPKCLALGITMA
jgi:hypothetical protein